MGGGEHHHGGHGGEHHHAPKWILPDWREYKVAGVPKAEEHVRKLAAVGLKDPWIRNEVWRYHPEFYRTPLRWMGWLVTRGARYGVGAFVLYVAYDQSVGAMRRRSEADKHHGDDHHAAEHH